MKTPPNTGPLLSTLVAFALILLFESCADSTGPASGALDVTVKTTTAAGYADRDGYTVRLDFGEARPITDDSGRFISIFGPGRIRSASKV